MTVAGSTACPQCDGSVALAESVRPSEIVECSHCSAELEVLTTDPLMLGIAPPVEEDWGE